MQKENETNQSYNVIFTEEFDMCLDHIQSFFADQGLETLIWWYAREDTYFTNMLNFTFMP